MDVMLIYFKKDGERKGFPLKEGKSVIGRKEDCDYRIPLNEVSREHCEFEHKEDAVIVRDLNSSNGTYVNNKRVAEAELKPGDQIIVGPVVFVVQIAGEPADPKPVRLAPKDEKQPSSEDLIDDVLIGGGEEDEETSKTELPEDESEVQEKDEGVSDDDFPFDEDEQEGEDDEDDPFKDALEAMAGGTDDEDEDDDDPFADLEEDDKV